MIKLCPFCGGVADWYVPNTHLGMLGVDEGVHHVECDICGARTPEYGTKDEAIQAWNQRSGWISVDERLPEDNAHEPIIVTNGKITGVAYYFTPRATKKIPEWRYDDEYYLEFIGQSVSHWMPLPAPPAL